MQEGYLVYECNSSCRCQQACQNRVLQKGVTVKLEVFRTLQKVGYAGGLSSTYFAEESFPFTQLFHCSDRLMVDAIDILD